MEVVPSAEEREWLLDCLRLLVRRRGASRFLEAPLLREADLGPWEPTVHGVTAMASRLLARAQLDRLTVEVRTGAGPRPILLHRAAYHPDTPLWLAGVEGNVVLLGLEAGAGLDRSAAVGLIAHELTHAWRLRHRLTVDEPQDEERLTDLTAVYLGLGVIAAHRATRIQRRRGTWGALGGWAPSEGASLAPEALAFLLAAQVLARRGSCLGAWRVGRALPTATRGAFVRALRELRAVPGGIPWRLRLPEPRPVRVARSVS